MKSKFSLDQQTNLTSLERLSAMTLKKSVTRNMNIVLYLSRKILLADFSMLFNGLIPLIAIQMQAFSAGSHLTVVFTKVLDELSFGLEDEDEKALTAPTDRAYWEVRATKETVSLADDILNCLKEFDDDLTLNFNKFYIGIEKEGQPFNFVAFKPNKTRINFEIKLPLDEGIDQKISSTGLDTLGYDRRSGSYRIQLSPNEIANNREILTELSQLAYKRRMNLS